MPDLIPAVIYARYSSHSQSEQSIEGQLHDGYAFAERCGYHVINEYIDRALTGMSDDRPAFQKMMKDATKKQFKIVIVWKLDRFARNRYDSAIYKNHLRKYGVRVVSVMENISDSPEGIILEGLLESMAEYYSVNLSENIKRGQSVAVSKGWFCGGSIPYGYRVQDHKLVPDEKTAPILREIYARYADGESLASISEDLNSRGYHTNRGGKFSTGTFDRIIPNPAYIGEYTYKGAVVPGCSTPLIEPETFRKAIERRRQHKRQPAAGRSPVSFLLQGKLFCGLCGLAMCGDSATSKTGDRHYYYSCSGRKHHRNDCKKAREKKDFLEWYVCEQTVQYILTPDQLQAITSAVVRLYDQENDDTRIKDLERIKKRVEDELNKLVDRLATVPERAVSRITERMDQLENDLINTETELAKLKIQQKIRITEKEVAAWLQTFSRGDLFDLAFRIKLIDTFINSIYLWDDKIVIFFNVSGGKQTSYIEPLDPDEIENSGQSSTLSGGRGAYPDKVEPGAPYFVFVRGMIGLVVFRTN